MISNPYLEQYRLVNPHSIRDLSYFEKRAQLIETYAWAVPTYSAINALVNLGPLVEIGAGLGYWASLIQQSGGFITPYDSNVLDNQVQVFNLNTYATPYTKVHQGSWLNLVNHTNDTLFLCWPPMSDMAWLSLKFYLDLGGQTLAYIGESNGGCTADNHFFQLIDAKMELVSEVDIPNWFTVNDYLSIYKVKGDL